MFRNTHTFGLMRSVAFRFWPARRKKEPHIQNFTLGLVKSSVIRMVMKIESLSDNSLILVEEIENGLHPVATARMVEYLIDVAQRKSAQAMFTTHSNDALAPLPPDRKSTRLNSSHLGISYAV